MGSTPIFSLRVPDVYKALETSSEGLSADEAQARRSLYGFNLLSEQVKISQWEKLAAQFAHPVALLLLAVGILVLLRGDLVLGVAIFALVLANAGFSFWRGYQSEKAIEKLRQILPAYARVIREGKDIHLHTSELVPGDILILAEGDNVSADARVVEEYGLRVNNSTLTGEAVPARKTADPSLQSGLSDLERPNLIFAGTTIASGTGRAVVYSTGMLTQFGRIAHLTQTVEEVPSRFHNELARLSKTTTWIALGIGAIVAVVGFFELQMKLSELILLTLGIIVAAIPEGLQATLTLSLAMAVQRLALHNVLAKKLSIVETLGSVSVICTDKSGTLTQNQMTVREIWVARQRIRVSGAGYEPKGSFSPSPIGSHFENDWMQLLDAALSCNNARINPPSLEHPQWTSLGDQTEAAMKVAALKANLNEEALKLDYPRVHEIPFDARRKRMTTVHRTAGKEVAFVKGAPREILGLSSHILVNGKTLPLDDALRSEILAANDGYARGALRVLALARRELPLRSTPYTVENVERDLTFLGLMAMMDPPRPEVEKAIQVCQQAGIRIAMITGDYGLTAESIARRVGMITTPNPTILTGAELDAMNDAELQTLLPKEVLFARMAPEHKLRLVSAFQARGDVVAVTGDGVNDAPALRKADVGISMGVIGTDVAKEAADIILTTDNFGAIIYAIEEGRAVFDNIRKFITYIFSSNVPEILPFMVAGSFPTIPLALTVRQILAIDLGTDLFPALALGMEKPEPDVMQHPPRSRNQPLLDRSVIGRAFWLGSIEAALCYTGFFAVYVLSGNAAILQLPYLNLIPMPLMEILKLSIAPASVYQVAITVFHAGVVMSQVGNAFACRSSKTRSTYLGWLSNRNLLLGVAIEIAVIVALIYIPFLATAFNHAQLPAQYWLGLGVFGPVLYSLEWIRKAISRRLDRIRIDGPHA
jgi:magnesium-transporting ATPase (P-type)